MKNAGIARVIYPSPHRVAISCVFSENFQNLLSSNLSENLPPIQLFGKLLEPELSFQEKSQKPDVKSNN